MTQKLCVRVGDHQLLIRMSNTDMTSFVESCFLGSSDRHIERALPFHLVIDIEDGFGEPFADFSVSVSKCDDRIVYRRNDYRIEVDKAYRVARISVYDRFALKHALMNLYSVFIVARDWGLLVHASCVMDQAVAHLFAGRSGSGKSTVAQLSQPRTLLSDEATVLRIGDEGVHVFDSPFRSDTVPSHTEGACPLSSINLLHQSQSVLRAPLSSSDAMFAMLDKVFYWPTDSGDTIKVVRLLRRMVRQVPAFRLHFQKHPRFWEAIS